MGNLHWDTFVLSGKVVSLLFLQSDLDCDDFIWWLLFALRVQMVVCIVGENIKCLFDEVLFLFCYP